MTEPEPTPIDDDVTFSQLSGEHLGRLVRLDGHDGHDGRQFVGRLICVSLSTSRWTPELHEIRVEIKLEWNRDQVVTVQEDGHNPVTFVKPPVVEFVEFKY